MPQPQLSTTFFIQNTNDSDLGLAILHSGLRELVGIDRDQRQLATIKPFQLFSADCVGVFVYLVENGARAARYCLRLRRLRVGATGSIPWRPTFILQAD